jgi:NAD(P)-dependent dehydrogenase (short-subunit alcohol dehydrogenase family)
VLFVNAGVAKNVPLADTSESVFDEQFDTNIKGAYFTIQKSPAFVERRGFSHLEHQRCGQQRYGRHMH